MNTDFINKWFTGKALTNATEAMSLLNESIAAGYWVGRASVKVPAALSKSNVANKASKKSEEINARAKDYNNAAQRVAWEVQHNLYFGSFTNIAKVDFAALEAVVTTNEAKATVSMAKEFASDFAEVVVAIATLNKESDANKKVAKSNEDGNLTGICACCFRAQKVKPTGTMFKHGYERPGYGYVVGGCPGDEFPPYSVR